VNTLETLVLEEYLTRRLNKYIEVIKVNYKLF
jgi:hypothetical protein